MNQASWTTVDLPRAPWPDQVWRRALRAASIANFLLLLHQLTVLASDFWLLQSVGMESVFWTNFWMGAKLWVIAFVAFAAAVLVPALTHPLSKAGRKVMFELTMLVGTISAFFFCRQYGQFLLSTDNAVPFGKTDPVFGKDLGFYIYDLDNLWTGWKYAMVASVVFLVVSAIVAYRSSREEEQSGRTLRGFARLLAMAGSTTTQVALGISGAIAAVGVWLMRYDLLYKDNTDSSVWTGAEALDVSGFFSNLNYINLTTLLMLVDDAVLIMILVVLRRAWRGEPAKLQRSPARALAITWGLILLLDFSFKGMVEVRNWISIRPNEPVVQMPYIQRNVEATRAAFMLDRVQEIEYRPNTAADPPANADQLLAATALRQAPLWPGFSSYLERHIDIQHAERIFQTGGDQMIYGPSLEVFRQRQQLRTYYDILGVDTVRYAVGGEKQMFVSAVREAPLFEPVPWLGYWGQRYMLYTHGYGLVAAPMSSSTPEGNPDFVSFNIPVEVKHPELAVENPRIYYGEGSATMAFSNVRDVPELDFPTDQGRQTLQLGEEVDAGVHIDSFWKRLVFGWRSDRFFEIVFSDLIEDSTRIHFYRRPIERLQQIAPFLFYDSNIYAVAAEGELVWMVNGLTTSLRYPYSWPAELGDKSDHRSPFPKEERDVNYIEDSVKVTVSAATGQVRLYKMTNDPLIETWSRIYPAMFAPATSMPESVRRQITYPVHLFHTQFDDHYIYYHQNDPMYFFNMEDMWDDGDDVLGPMLDEGKAITFSIEPYNLMLDTGGLLPASSDATQFSLAAVFTPENALNLRAIPIAYQDGQDYGKLAVLMVPKGLYVPSPEQADAMIDQDPSISQYFAWWNRRGMEVVRGHTTLIPVGNEVIYVEPIFLRSRQQPLTQLKKVAVVYRGKPVLADSVEEALRRAIAGMPTAPPSLDAEAISTPTQTTGG